MSTDWWIEAERRRTVAATIAVLVLALVLTACGGDDEPETQPELDLPGSSSPTGESSSPPSEDPPDPGVPEVRPAPEQGDRLDDSFGVWALQLPEDRRAKEVAQALVEYMEVRSGAYFEGEAPLDALARVSVGQPLTEVQGYVLDLRDAGLHTVGDFWFTLTDRTVSVAGKQATITDVCTQNATANVNARGIAQESPSDAYLTDATAVRAARDIWLISSISFEAVDSC